MLIPLPTPIVHITHLRNLEGILAFGGLSCCASLKARKIEYIDSANTTVQDRRASFPVPVPPGGLVHDYVPFYFHPRSPMLFVISRDAVRYPDGQAPIIQLVSTVQSVVSQRPFVFTDGHAIMALTRYFTDTEYLDQIDWPLMKLKFWNDTVQDGDRKRRRQAEFLVHEFLPWSCVTEISVRNRQTELAVITLLKDSSHQPPVRVRSACYY